MKLFITLLALVTLYSDKPPASWQLSAEKEGIKVYTRIKEGQKLKELKAVTTFNCSLDNMYNTFVDIQKMNAWYDTVEKVELLQKISATEGIYKIFFDFPALTGDRYSTIKASIQKDGKGNILVQTRYVDIPHQQENDYIFVKNIESSWKITGQRGQLLVEHIAFMDPSGSIPNWIFNSFLTQGPIRTLTNLKKFACP